MAERDLFPGGCAGGVTPIQCANGVHPLVKTRQISNAALLSSTSICSKYNGVPPATIAKIPSVMNANANANGSGETVVAVAATNAGAVAASNARLSGKKVPIRVGFYDIERTIGKGNFAVVKLAKHRITKNEVRAILITLTDICVLICGFFYYLFLSLVF